MFPIQRLVLIALSAALVAGTAFPTRADERTPISNMETQTHDTDHPIR